MSLGVSYIISSRDPSFDIHNGPEIFISRNRNARQYIGFRQTDGSLGLAIMKDDLWIPLLATGWFRDIEIINPQLKPVKSRLKGV